MSNKCSYFPFVCVASFVAMARALYPFGAVAILLHCIFYHDVPVPVFFHHLFAAEIRLILYSFRCFMGPLSIHFEPFIVAEMRAVHIFGMIGRVRAESHTSPPSTPSSISNSTARADVQSQYGPFMLSIRRCIVMKRLLYLCRSLCKSATTINLLPR